MAETPLDDDALELYEIPGSLSLSFWPHDC